MSVAVAPHAEGAVFEIRAQPGARRNAIVGEHDGCLKVAVTQAPEKGKANEALADVLCETLGLRRGQIVLVAGETSRRKKFLVRGLSCDDLAARIAKSLDG